MKALDDRIPQTFEPVSMCAVFSERGSPPGAIRQAAPSGVPPGAGSDKFVQRARYSKGPTEGRDLDLSAHGPGEPVDEAYREIPEDLDAEEHVVGCATASRYGARLAHERLTVSDFYLPQAARAFSASVLPTVASVTDQDARIGLVAELGEVDRRWLERVVDDRPVQHDLAGSLAGQVCGTSRRRRVMRLAADLHARASRGDLEDLDDDLLLRLEVVARAR